MRPLRRTASAALGLLAALVLAAGPAAAAQTVILVRHAEKVDASADPPLSKEGEARAARLAKLLERARITHVFTSELVRTKATAAPLARQKQLTPAVVPARDEAGLVSRIRSLPEGSVVLVVGHSNTLPSLLKALGAGESLTIADEEYGRVFVLVRQAGGPPSVLELSY